MIKTAYGALGPKLDALARLWLISDKEFNAFMGTYAPLFSASPENTKVDYDNGVPLKGYVPGSSSELTQYYKVIHWLCTLGSVEKMYMPPTLDVKKSVFENQLLLEQQIAAELQVGAGAKVLELGCGCGAIAAHMASLTRAAHYGVNIDPSQIQKAHKNPKLKRANFTVGDFNRPLQFADQYFDAVYAIQPMTYVSDMSFTLAEVARVLKPGGRFVINDVAALDNYNKDNPHHKLLIQHTRELTAFGGLWHYKYWEDAFTKSGFRVLKSAGKDAVAMVKKEVALYDIFEAVFKRLSQLRLMPQKLFLMLQRMHANGQSYIQAEQLGLISLNWQIVAQKPS